MSRSRVGAELDHVGLDLRAAVVAGDRDSVVAVAQDVAPADPVDGDGGSSSPRASAIHSDFQRASHERSGRKLRSNRRALLASVVPVIVSIGISSTPRARRGAAASGAVESSTRSSPGVRRRQPRARRAKRSSASDCGLRGVGRTRSSTTNVAAMIISVPSPPPTTNPATSSAADSIHRPGEVAGRSAARRACWLMPPSVAPSVARDQWG